MTTPVIKSLLDTDMYKLTMHAAVFTNFPESKVVYKYTNRSSQMKFTLDGINWLKEQFHSLANLTFTAEDIQYLKTVIPYLPYNYIQYISSPEFKLKPDEQIKFTYEAASEGDINDTTGKQFYDLHIFVEGFWKETILYEIPILALVSEAYFKFTETDWSYENQVEIAYQKAKTLFQNNAKFSEFGTRRRRSYRTQELVLQGIMKAVNENAEVNSKLFLGTSNVLFAKEFNVKPIGTVAHEWIMGIASITGDYVNANKNSMKYWVETFGLDNAGLALTDTFGTEDFLKSFIPPYSDKYVGVRQDSGDPEEYTKKIAHHYHHVLKLPKDTKVICYSDSLNPEKAIHYAAIAKEHGLVPTFGIGTNFTNDFYKKTNSSIISEPLNIVLKLLELNGNHAIKISDNIGKNMGDPETIKKVKEVLGYSEKGWIGDNEAHRWSA
ncbi:hypothetical protein TPHA_0B02820 [Tetrapisispora phaffii CBS 4417]|uniref:Nicotinate phosphoribosyltransferase n=1 Tax=Tetrapisispora phaffii (strain ATCC 24235 / CBS 4417 / NBRC 1672 / NRRL Y-8282 / UCD 70-5) TaxID=1071381 RepID=G8BPM3_TETPH|nr:hypothetical protein TPHA_0B02820 [Tetrapisispora phaffii CBS 4417]CCE61954.1 hypothetical protein TPHA_0B02820 [Tetrapisispora phaffii CBS 4417]